MHPNLVDHLAAFIAVAETSSFSAAARRIGRAVSTISYSVARLEDHCGFPLLVRGSGPPELTAEGRALFREAHAIVDGARRFEARARSLGRGEESRLSIAVDVLFPMTPLVAGLGTFLAEYPHVRRSSSRPRSTSSGATFGQARSTSASRLCATCRRMSNASP
jgi:DNA-binding transcriptional LysR family regulator